MSQSVVFDKAFAFVLRKASETEYPLRLLYHAKFLGEKEFNTIENDRVEIFRMLNEIVKTSKARAA